MLRRGPQAGQELGLLPLQVQRRLLLSVLLALLRVLVPPLNPRPFRARGGLAGGWLGAWPPTVCLGDQRALLTARFHNAISCSYSSEAFC